MQTWVLLALSAGDNQQHLHREHPADQGFTPAELKRSGMNLIRSQGNGYTGFPRVERLRSMHGKQPSRPARDSTRRGRGCINAA